MCGGRVVFSLPAALGAHLVLLYFSHFPSFMRIFFVCLERSEAGGQQVGRCCFCFCFLNLAAYAAPQSPSQGLIWQ